MVSPVSRIRTGVPVAPGATACTASEKRRRTRLSAASPAREHLDPRLAARRDPIRPKSRAEGFRGSRDPLSAGRALGGAGSGAASTTASEAAARASGDAWDKRSRTSARRRAASAAASSLDAASAARRSPAAVAARSSDHLGVRGRRPRLDRVERGPEEHRGVADHLQLLLLPRGQEAAQRHRPRHLRQRFEAPGERVRFGERGGEHLDGVRRPVGIRQEHGERRHRTRPAGCGDAAG